MRRFVDSVLRIRNEHRVGFLTQLREFRRFNGVLGFTRAEFINYGLWNTKRDLENRMATISHRDRSTIERRMNPRDEARPVNDKEWATAVLAEAGLPIAPVLAIASLSQTHRPTTHRFPIISDQEAVTALLAQAPADGVVFKPTRGGMGRSVMVFREANRERLIHLDGTIWPIELLLKQLAKEDDWKIEARLVQHPTLIRLAGETLGTMRITTFTTKDNVVHLAPPVWKVPIGNSGLDHFSHGTGLPAAPVDPVTGIIGAGRFWKRLDVIERHPLTGEQFAGQVMPFWSEAFELAKNVATCFPTTASLGQDIAITADGPVVIEVNRSWAESLVQVPWQQGLIQGEFLRFLEELGCEDVIRREVRGI